MLLSKKVNESDSAESWKTRETWATVHSQHNRENYQKSCQVGIFLPFSASRFTHILILEDAQHFLSAHVDQLLTDSASKS